MAIERKNTPFFQEKRRRRSQRRMSKNRPFLTLFCRGRGCVASRMESDPPPPPRRALNFYSYDIFVPRACARDHSPRRSNIH